MKKIIALMLVLLLMLTMFVACKKDPEPSEEPSTPVTEDPSENPGDGDHWDNVGKSEKPNQNEGLGIETPILPIQ